VKPYQVAIPSYRRADMLAARTLPFLLDGGVPPERITVFVHDHDHGELPAYHDLAARHGVDLAVTSARGINAQRAEIRGSYTTGTHLVQVDDDVTVIKRAVDRTSLEPVTDVDGFFRQAFAETQARGLWSWGLSAVPNAYFMRPGHISDDLKFVIFSLFGNIVRPGHPVYANTVPTKDDYEFSLRSWWYDGGIVRFNDHVAVADIYRAPGGCQDTRTVAQAEQSVESLLRQWPGIVRRNARRKSTFPEILLNRRARHAGHAPHVDPPGVYHAS
jgi:TET-associated glycosyltransferase-like protein